MWYWDDYFGTYGSSGTVTVADVVPPEVHPTWMVVRDTTCRFDGYHTSATVDLGTAASGVVRLESAGDDLRVYDAMNGVRESEISFGLGSAAT
ncbi:MAG: hypothetical protein KC621_18755 [Myxococcales bacterium]|nr:hypothetical protein [Myxococcales bacterium]